MLEVGDILDGHKLEELRPPVGTVVEIVKSNLGSYLTGTKCKIIGYENCGWIMMSDDFSVTDYDYAYSTNKYKVVSL